MKFDDRSDAVYDEAIRPALAEHGLRAVRTDRLGLTGDVVDCIRRALASCSLAVADTTGDHPNVMDEPGMAQADRKPVVMIWERDASGAIVPPPFDIQSEQSSDYGRDLSALRDVLARALSVVLGKSQSLDAEERVLASTSSESRAHSASTPR